MQQTHFKRPGPAPDFPPIAAFLENWAEHRDLSDELQRLERFAATDSSSPGEGAWRVVESLVSVARHLNHRAQDAALKVQPKWLPDFVRATAYGYWAHRLAMSEYRQRELDHAFALHEAGFILGSCVTLGWLDHARSMAVQMAAAFDTSFYYDRDDAYHRRAQTFVLRLALDWNGSRREWPSYAFDVPAYDYLVHHWRDKDPDVLLHALLAACDRHMHEAHEDSPHARHDICAPHYVYLPFEILAVMRLREQHGLALPYVDHTLMLTPLGRLPKPQTWIEDEVLTTTISRVRRDHPQL